MRAYEIANERYAALGVDTEEALRKLDAIPISIHCWQGDDVTGFERGEALSGGIQSTGNHPGRAKTVEELRDYLQRAMEQIPGTVRVNLHAVYGDVKGVERDQIGPKHFAAWVDWAKQRNVGLDFNPTLYSHPKTEDGLTLSHPDKAIRDFWIAHCKRTREIGAYFGKELGTPAVVNLWAIDGFKDVPADRLTPRMRLEQALDEVFAERSDPRLCIDTVESKLFGLGLESYTVGSHEFYLGYAIKNHIGLCLDAGHFHPTEVISAKITAVSLFVDQLLLHVSRPVRWDSDHVVLLDDELLAIAQEVIRHDLLDRVHIGLDYFDGSIDRVTAWMIGTRNMRKALLIALLEPYEKLREAEHKFDFTNRMIWMEESKSLPWSAVWEEYCARKNVAACLVSR